MQFAVEFMSKNVCNCNSDTYKSDVKDYQTKQLSTLTTDLHELKIS